VAETSCRYFREIGFPAPIETGLVVDRIGTSSIIYRIGLFQGPGDEAAAEGRFVHVYVDNTDPSRTVTPMPDVIRAAVAPLLRGGSE
jgi:acyl-CoA thioester hydrolase